MLADFLGVVGLAALCGAWVLVQRFVARHDPEAPGVEGGCGGGSCHGPRQRPPA